MPLRDGLSQTSVTESVLGHKILHDCYIVYSFLKLMYKKKILKF